MWEAKMIIIRVELHSAITREVTELARMHISNTGTGTTDKRNYLLQTFRGRSKRELDNYTIQRQQTLENWPSERLHVWNLVCYALAALGYTQGP
jgi:hypothetical protein